MRKPACVLILTLGCLFLSHGALWAQYGMGGMGYGGMGGMGFGGFGGMGMGFGGMQGYRPSYSPQPVFSPYLNLFRQDNPLFLNYYGLVQPQFQFQSGIGQLQQNVGGLQQAVMSGNALPPTGHFSGFQTQRFYFMNLGMGGMGMGGYGMGGMGMGGMGMGGMGMGGFGMGGMGMGGMMGAGGTGIGSSPTYQPPR